MYKNLALAAIVASFVAPTFAETNKNEAAPAAEHSTVKEEKKVEEKTVEAPKN